MNSFVKDERIIEELFEKLKLGEIENIDKYNSNQNHVYKAKIQNKYYVVKKFSKDAIKNDYDLYKKKQQIKFSKELNKKNINTIVPLIFKGREFIKYKGDYYLIYNYYNYETLKKENIKNIHIEKMASTLAKIHELKIKENLPCHYKKIDINFNEYIKLYKKIDKKVCKVLETNQEVLEELIKNCNDNIKYAKEKMCVSHNDYKLLNMLWNKNELYLLDFDAVGLVNPEAAMIEAAFSLSLHNNIVNMKHLKLFIKRYSQIIKIDSNEYKIAIEVAMNGKLKWFRYILNKGLEEKKYRNDILKMLEEFLTYYEHKSLLENLEVNK